MASLEDQLLSSKSNQFEKLSKGSDWLVKSLPTKKCTSFLDIQAKCNLLS